MIDQGLNSYRTSEMYAEDSIDDGRSMVESLSGKDDAIVEDPIILQTRALLADLKNDEDGRDEAAEEAKRNEVEEKMARMKTLIDQADEMRQKNKEAEK